MVTIEGLLKIAKDYEASDVHITVGVPPKMRVSGELIDMNYPKLMPDDANALIKELLNPKLAKILDEKGEVDFSFSMPHVGRYRVNVFRQRGSLAAVIRVIKFGVPDPALLGIPENVLSLADNNTGLVLVTGAAGS